MYTVLSLLVLFTAFNISNVENMTQTLNIPLTQGYSHSLIGGISRGIPPRSGDLSDSSMGDPSRDWKDTTKPGYFRRQKKLRLLTVVVAFSVGEMAVNPPEHQCPMSY